MKGGETMANGFEADGGALYTGDFYQLLSSYIGNTVTIFTTSGGESGAGFTGVILSVNRCFVRLVTRIGAAPSCALGNGCDGGMVGGYGGGYGGGVHVNTVGSVTDIPLDRIASFVHNAV